MEAQDGGTPGRWSKQYDSIQKRIGMHVNRVKKPAQEESS